MVFVSKMGLATVACCFNQKKGKRIMDGKKH